MNWTAAGGVILATKKWGGSGETHSQGMWFECSNSWLSWGRERSFGIMIENVWFSELALAQRVGTLVGWNSCSQLERILRSWCKEVPTGFSWFAYFSPSVLHVYCSQFFAEDYTKHAKCHFCWHAECCGRWCASSSRWLALTLVLLAYGGSHLSEWVGRWAFSWKKSLRKKRDIVPLGQEGFRSASPLE